MPKEEKGKKQVLLRLSKELWQDLADWAEDDFRSINGQIEFLLNECVRKRKKSITRSRNVYQDFAGANKMSDEEYQKLLKKYGIEEPKAGTSDLE